MVLLCFTAWCCQLTNTFCSFDPLQHVMPCQVEMWAWGHRCICCMQHTAWSQQRMYCQCCIANATHPHAALPQLPAVLFVLCSVDPPSQLLMLACLLMGAIVVPVMHPAAREGLANRPYRCDRVEWARKLLQLTWDEGFMAIKAAPESGKTSALQLVGQQMQWLAEHLDQSGKVEGLEVINVYYISMLGCDTLDDAVQHVFAPDFNTWRELLDSCSTPRSEAGEILQLCVCCTRSKLHALVCKHRFHMCSFMITPANDCKLCLLWQYMHVVARCTSLSQHCNQMVLHVLQVACSKSAR